MKAILWAPLITTARTATSSVPGPLHGQIVLEATEQPLSEETPPVPSFRVKAPASNKQVAWIGAQGVNKHNGYALDPGEWVEYVSTLLRPSNVFAVGTKGDKITWIAPPGG